MKEGYTMLERISNRINYIATDDPFTRRKFFTLVPVAAVAAYSTPDAIVALVKKTKAENKADELKTQLEHTASKKEKNELTQRLTQANTNIANQGERITEDSLAMAGSAGAWAVGNLVYDAIKLAIKGKM